jgi:serine/threonine protein kinase
VRHVESWSELRLIAEQVASTLCRVHQLGWVHGDVKPSNILRDDNGQIKVSDATKIGSIPRRYSEGFRAPETLAKDGAVC